MLPWTGTKGDTKVYTKITENYAKNRGVLNSETEKLLSRAFIIKQEFISPNLLLLENILEFKNKYGIDII
jgi:hypothetical protein